MLVGEPLELDLALLAAVARPPDRARAYELATDLWCLAVPLPYQRVPTVNCYLLADADGWLLVDCGADWDALAHALGLAAVAPAQITTLVLTHSHSDHAGIADEVARRTGCAVVRGPGPYVVTDALREPLLPLSDRRRFVRSAGVPEALVDLFADSRVADHGLEVRRRADRVLGPGETLAGRWRMVPAPGHSVDQFVLHDGDRVIGADVAYPSQPFLEWGFAPDPYADHVASLTRVAALGARVLLPGHGRPDEDPAGRIVTARAALARFTGACLDALLDGPATAYDAACAIAGNDPDPDTRQSALASAIAVLDHHVTTGALRASTDADGVRRYTAVIPPSTTKSVPVT